MSIIPCARNPQLQAQIAAFAEVLKTEAHKLGEHGLDEAAFYASGILRGAVEQLRGEYIAQTRGKHEFARHVLNHMQDRGAIVEWEESGREARNDFVIRLPSGRTAVIDLKGGLDGNNTTIAERPDDADEFVVWSLSTNLGGDPRRNAWSGVHTRLGADMVARRQRVDGLIVWDMFCGTSGRLCPKLAKPGGEARTTVLGPFQAPPPCIYVFPAALPDPDHPPPHARPLAEVELLAAFHACFGGSEDEVNYVEIVADRAGDVVRRSTTVTRAGQAQRSTGMTPIRRAKGTRV